MQIFLSEQYALEAWEMQSVFVQICYRNVDSRYNKNREVTMCEHVQNGENVRPKNT